MKLERYTTPKAKCLWAFLQQPKHDPDGEYEDVFEITLLLENSNKEHQDLLNFITKAYRAAGGVADINKSGHPIKNHYELVDGKDESGEPVKIKQYIDNQYEVRFKTKAEYTDHIVCFDSQLNVTWKEKNFVANGSVVKVNWSYKPYNNKGNKGISLFLNYIQIIDLIEWTPEVTAETCGFEKEEGYQIGDNVETAEPVDNLPMSDEDLNGQDGSPVEDDLPF